MKKVLIIATVGGFLKKFEMGNVRILQELGYEVHYAANMQNQIYRFDPAELEAAGIRIHPMEILKSPFAIEKHRQIIRQLTALIDREQISLIHCHTPVGGYLGRLAGKQCREQGVKVIYTSHGFHFYEGAPFLQGLVFRQVEQYLAGMTDVIITINREDYQSASRFRLKPGGKVYQIPSVGLDMEMFQPPRKEERDASRKRLGIAPEQFFLLSVGELNQNKNHKIVLRAMQELQRSGEDISKIVYGICGDGPGRQALETEIGKLGLEKQAVLYGYCDPVRDYLAGADAVAFPSRREGLGMAALEALSMGIPILAADNRGTREYMVHGQNGYRYDWLDVIGFANGIRLLYNQTAQEKEKMKIFCRDSVKKFEVSRTEAAMRQIYQEICSRS